MSEPISLGGVARLRHRVRLEATVRTATSGGAALVTWLPVAELWASVEPITGSERVDADARAGRLTHSVTLRYRSDVTTAHRFVFGTRILDIRSVRDLDERHVRLVCLCDETTP